MAGRVDCIGEFDGELSVIDFKTSKKIKSSADIEDYYWQHKITRDLVELRNIICVAELIVKSALKREGSRGGHYREDFPLCLKQSITKF